jgi:hypothetical protein
MAVSKTLEYYFKDGRHIVFNKYTIDDEGNIINIVNKKKVTYSGEYNGCGVRDDTGKTLQIRVARALVSTFHGKPPTSNHTADHIDRNIKNDTLSNLRWATKREQVDNRDMPADKHTALIVIRDGVEKSVKEWVEYLKDTPNSFGRKYTKNIIEYYAQKNKFGFSFKIYQNLPGEEWKSVKNSDTTMGRWEVSNMNRVKYVTKHAENIIDYDKLCVVGGNPVIGIKGKLHFVQKIVDEVFRDI